MAELGYSPGLAGVVAGATRISSVGQAGLRYRGYDIAKLAETVCFEEVLHLLVYGELPTRRQLAFLRDTLMEFRDAIHDFNGLKESEEDQKKGN